MSHCRFIDHALCQVYEQNNAELKNLGRTSRGLPTNEIIKTIMLNYWNEIICSSNIAQPSCDEKAICITLLVPHLVKDYEDNMASFTIFLQPVVDHLRDETELTHALPSFIDLLSGIQYYPSSDVLPLSAQVSHLRRSIPYFCFNRNPYYRATPNMGDYIFHKFSNLWITKKPDEFDDILLRLLIHARAWPFLLSSACMYALLTPVGILDRILDSYSQVDGNKGDTPDHSYSHLHKGHDAQAQYLYTELLFSSTTNYKDSFFILDKIRKLKYPEGVSVFQ